MADLTTTIGPLQLKNPVLVASGTFGYGQEVVGLMDLNRLGAVVTKSVSLEPRPGNPPPRICELPGGMLNSIGLANVGVEAFVEQKLPFLAALDTKLIVNIAGRTPDDYVAVIHHLEDQPNIDGYELNFSCPNVKKGGLEFSQDPTTTAGVVNVIRKQTQRPLIAKLTPNVTRIREIAQAAADGGVDAVSLINTLVGFAVDVETRRPRIHAGAAGYSGPAIKPVALAKVLEVAEHVDIPIIGIGGICNVTDALEFLITGACAIQVGTANFIDPGSAPRIVDELEQYMNAHKLAALPELIGSLKKWS